MSLRLTWSLFSLTLALFFGLLFGQYNLLPERLASHFGLDGLANGWMARDTYVAVMAGAGLLIISVSLLPVLILRQTGGAGLNLPHRTYWLAPEQIEATQNWLLRAMLLTNSIVLLFLSGAHELVIEANRHPQPQVTSVAFLILLGFVILSNLALVICVYQRFGQVPK